MPTRSGARAGGYEAMLLALAVSQSKASARTEENRKRRREEAFVAAGGQRMNDEDALAAVAEAEAEERACPTCLGSNPKEAFIITEAGCEHEYCIQCLDDFKVMHSKKKRQWNGTIGVSGAWVRVLKYGALRCPVCQSPADSTSGTHYAPL